MLNVKACHRAMVQRAWHEGWSVRRCPLGLPYNTNTCTQLTSEWVGDTVDGDGVVRVVEVEGVQVCRGDELEFAGIRAPRIRIWLNPASHTSHVSCMLHGKRRMRLKSESDVKCFVHV